VCVSEYGNVGFLFIVLTVIQEIIFRNAKLFRNPVNKSIDFFTF